MNDLFDAVERLTRSMEALDRRVSALEHPARAAAPSSAVPAPPALSPSPSLSLGTGGVFPVLGKAMLCVAGAYLLRAAVQSDSLPRWPTIVIAIAYAFVWLLPAVRVAAQAWLASVVWAATSALILVPMLWELTLRFRFLPATGAAAILTLFAVAASALAWRQHFAAVSWTAISAAGVAALVLGIATRDLVPFLLALLVMYIVSETAAALARASGVRVVIALAADLALFAMIWINSGPPASHAEYLTIGTPVLLAFAPALLLVSAASATVQTLVLGRGISFFATAQALVAALLTVWSIFAFSAGHGVLMLGLMCLAASAAGYGVAFASFDRTHAQRNYHVYATGSLALLLAGIWLSLPSGWLPLCAALLAVAAVILGARTRHATLLFHGLALLVMAVWYSSLFVAIAGALLGAPPVAPGWIASLSGVSAVLCYAGLPPSGLRRWWGELVRLLFGAMAVGTLTALVVWIAIRVTAVAVAPGAAHVAVIRTLACCVTALALAWSNSRWQRKEQVWLVWAALVFTACKILFEDLRHGHLGYTAVSIFLYAVTLLLIPRLLRARSTTYPGGGSDQPAY
jgi:hypothetical protein